MSIDVTARTLNGRGGPIPTRDYRPSYLATPDVSLLWIHGGGFAVGSMKMKESDAVARSLAERGIQVRTLDYRLAPNFLLHPGADKRPSPNRFPAALEDVLDALADLDASTGDGSRGRAGIGGASAGAALASGALMRLKDEGTPLPPAAIYAYGVFHPGIPPLPDDVRIATSGRHRFLQFRPKLADRLVRNYVGSPELLHDHHAFAGGGDLHGMPPSLLMDSEHDTLRASGVLYASELRAAEVDVEYRVSAGARHGFLGKPTSTNYAEGIDAMDRWLTAHPAAVARG